MLCVFWCVVVEDMEGNEGRRKHALCPTSFKLRAVDRVRRAKNLAARVAAPPINKHPPAVPLYAPPCTCQPLPAPGIGGPVSSSNWSWKQLQADQRRICLAATSETDPSSASSALMAFTSPGSKSSGGINSSSPAKWSELAYVIPSDNLVFRVRAGWSWAFLSNAKPGRLLRTDFPSGVRTNSESSLSESMCFRAKKGAINTSS
jgi:hypothetical protein